MCSFVIKEEFQSLTYSHSCRRQWLPSAESFSSHLHRISLLLDACYPVKLLSQSSSFILRKKLSHKGSCPGNMVGVQKFPTAITLEGLQYQFPHGQVHCHATWTVDVCENLTAFVATPDANDVPGTYDTAVHWWVGPVGVTAWHPSYATVTITVYLVLDISSGKESGRHHSFDLHFSLHLYNHPHIPSMTTVR